MYLLDVARGPLLAAALAILAAGSIWRVLVIVRRPTRHDYSEARPHRPVAGALRGILQRMWPSAVLRPDVRVGVFNAYAYHIGLAIVFFGFAPHIAFVQRLTGLAWPAVPGWLFVAAVASVFIGLAYALIARLTSPVLRLLSGFDDYASWALTLLPVLTGMAVLSLPLDAAYPARPLYPGPVAVHLLSVLLLLVYLPFGKLSHVFLVFVSRGTTGAAFARKGAAP